MLKSGVDEIDRRMAAMALPKMSPGCRQGAEEGRRSAARFDPLRRGAIAVMRRNWNRDDERIAVLFAGQTCELELVASGRVAASGAWRFEIAQQGQQLQPVSDWESSCWYTDEDVDYLELEIELTGGVKLQRQIVLAREDRFLLAGRRPDEPAAVAIWNIAASCRWLRRSNSAGQRRAARGFCAGVAVRRLAGGRATAVPGSCRWPR